MLHTPLTHRGSIPTTRRCRTEIAKAYFFDLDGTLTDARHGLYLSFRAALSTLDIPEMSDEDLHRFLGTPLPEMFRVLKPGISTLQITAGINAFRSAYEDAGIVQNALYPGALRLLAAIARKGAVAWVVTSKPEHYAVRILRDLRINRYLQGVIGAGLDETDTKTELIARALVAANVDNTDAIMLGDRHYDIIGALENRIMPIGALWGYGSYDELYTAGCRHFVNSLDEFLEAFVGAEERTHVKCPG